MEQEILQQILTELKDLKAGQAQTNQRLNKVDARLSALEESQEVIKASQLEVELVQYPRIQAALDGFKSSQDQDDILDERITFLEGKGADHDKRLYALERAVRAG